MDKKRLSPMQDTLIKEKNFNIFHFTTTKSCGNMKDFDTRKDFCKRNSIDHKKIVFANQVHGTMVKKVSSADCETFIKDCDGLITNEKNIYLCIFTADCMPVFFCFKRLFRYCNGSCRLVRTCRGYIGKYNFKFSKQFRNKSARCFCLCRSTHKQMLLPNK